MNDNNTARTFTAHIAKTAENASPAMQPGLHESVAEFFAITGLFADIDSPLEKFEPTPGNEWLSAGFAAAVAYRPDASASFVLAVYVEGDVTRYRFPRFEDAARAGRLWSVGLI